MVLGQLREINVQTMIDNGITFLNPFI